MGKFVLRIGRPQIISDNVSKINVQTDKLITDENGIYTNGGAYSFPEPYHLFDRSIMTGKRRSFVPRFSN
jgi:hypothetical protein